MSRIHPLAGLHRFGLLAGVGIAFFCGLFGARLLRSMQKPALPPSERPPASSPAVNNGTALATTEPAKDPKKSRFDQTKIDAAELSALADQLRDELSKMNVNVLSLDVIQKTEQVEKLAKKIKGEGHGD